MLSTCPPTKRVLRLSSLFPPIRRNLEVLPFLYATFSFNQDHLYSLSNVQAKLLYNQSQNAYIRFAAVGIPRSLIAKKLTVGGRKRKGKDEGLLALNTISIAPGQVRKSIQNEEVRVFQVSHNFAALPLASAAYPH
jgi:hypothetical protein